MRLLEATVKNDSDIILQGDEHEGSVAAHTDGIDRLLQWVNEEPDRYYVKMGDAIEARCIDHPYFDIENVKETKPMQQTKAVIKRHESSKGRCLAWLLGNHEYGLQKFGNITEHICEELEIPHAYGGTTCKLKLLNKRGRQICKLYLCHPFRLTLNSNAKDEEQRIANMKARLKWYLRRKASDCLIMAAGHAHKLLVVNPVRRLLMTDDGQRVVQRYLEAGDGGGSYIEPDQRYYACTGSYLKTSQVGIDTYSERFGYDPVEIGHVKIKIRGGKVESVNEIVV